MENILASLSLYLQEGSFLAYAVSFFAGVLISFTPCVYPLIPINIGFIGNQSQGSKFKAFCLSIVFVSGTALTYSILGLIAALGGKVFGQIQTSPISFLLVGNVSLLLGLSMLGLFDLPVLRFSKSSAGLERGRISKFGILSGLGLGCIGGLIIGPCTTPVLGILLLYVSTQGNIFFGASLLFTFALGMGTLLILTGTFSYLLSSLPKSGKWNLRVKKGLGWFLIIYAEILFLRAGGLILW
ncbi:MAG: sulfite exporter TauE/SafE family protein [Candidatus Omnitrophica bacterium]|nr:sulfite exporter TauE/SafE family protein [Candidatus Omnitrophota bacterium]